MYCPQCGTQVPDVAKFCTKCGRPLTKPAARPTKSAQTEVSQTPSPSISGRESQHLSPHTESLAKLQVAEEKPLPNARVEQGDAFHAMKEPSITKLPPAQVLITLPEITAIPTKRLDFLMTGLGSLVVLVGFFFGWLHVSSPIANVIFSGLASLDLSGITIFTGFPDLGIPGSPWVALVPLLALLALLVNLPRIGQTKLGTYARVVRVGVGILGIAYMLIMLLGTQALYDNAFRQLGLPSVLGQQIIKLDPIIGFWLTLLGFFLVIGGAILDRERS